MCVCVLLLGAGGKTQTASQTICVRSFSVACTYWNMHLLCVSVCVHVCTYSIYMLRSLFSVSTEVAQQRGNNSVPV